VLDYGNVSGALLPLLASSYALIFMGHRMVQMYRDFEQSRDKGDFSALPELHALSSGMAHGLRIPGPSHSATQLQRTVDRNALLEPH
jgi:hypothetical protein